MFLRNVGVLFYSMHILFAYRTTYKTPRYFVIKFSGFAYKTSSCAAVTGILAEKKYVF